MTIFVPKSEAPTKPGWYYGRKKDSYEIMPLFCGYTVGSDSLTVEAYGYNRMYTYLFDWFGPVPQIKEATI